MNHLPHGLHPHQPVRTGGICGAAPASTSVTRVPRFLRFSRLDGADKWAEKDLRENSVLFRLLTSISEHPPPSVKDGLKTRPRLRSGPHYT